MILNKMAHEHAYRNTKQKQVILDALMRGRSHPTAQALYAVVKKKMPKIGLATVYRNLRVLVDEGKAREMAAAGRSSRYDGDISDHYHFTCKRCGATSDIFMTLPLDAYMRRRTRLDIHSHRAEFYGYCMHCSRKHGRTQIKKGGANGTATARKQNRKKPSRRICRGIPGA